MQSKFKNVLKKWRGKRTQKWAAAFLGVSLSTYRNWEQGRNVPTKLGRSMILNLISGDFASSRRAQYNGHIHDD